MDEQEIRTKLQGAIENTQKDVATIRTGRASSSLVENIVIEAYGGTTHMKIMELASINIPDPSQIVIEPWDKSIIGDIRKGIEAANVGLNPSIDGEIIRISIPPMTGEDREKYIKLLHTKIENGKITIRQIRGDSMKDIQKAHENKELSDDDKFRLEENLQKIIDEFNDKLDEIKRAKEEELRKV